MLPSSRNLLDIIFTKLNALRSTCCKPELFETTNLKRILISSHQKKFVEMSVVNVLA